MKNKQDGARNQTVGTVKETLGKALGNPSLRSTGATERLKGSLQSAEGHIKDAAQTAFKKMKSAFSSKSP